ncbi:serine hydrolase [Nitratireductor kimnyeongensis]|uniref:Serine hydrolase n=1 Tax=Nitratireductor kimnyeongensis TaxID=430679 RepID=A0ABW0TBT8_9HYPH|nr:serine hydrolase [Nitratireductor kimnyeongensis]QZZ36669.1 serine hydrolase [Nitratireductor kimnyeongensis]
MAHRILAGAAALALLAAPATARASDLPPPAQTAGIAIPEGQIDKAVEALDGLIEQAMKETGVPGLAVAVVRKDKVLFAKGYGVRKAGEKDAVDTDTVFQLASLSKSVGATVVANQVGKGLVHWDTPMSAILPWFKLSNPDSTALLTVGDLYAHRSGLPDHAGDDLEDLGYPQKIILEQLRYLETGALRLQYAYTNFGLTAAAEAVAGVAGKDWATLSEDAIYKPLGMEHTSSRLSDFLARDNRVYNHVRKGKTWEVRFQRDPDPQSPAGGVSASVNDMAKWMRMVLGDGAYKGEQIVDAAALLPALSPQAVSGHPATPAARAGFYGYGFGVSVSPAGRVMLSHSGAFALGAATNYIMIPSADVGIVVLTNAQPIGLAEGISMSFMDLVQFGEIQRDWLAMYPVLFGPMLDPVGKLAGQEAPKDAKPARELADYTGTFTNDYFGNLVVEETEGGLTMTVEGTPSTFQLEHWTGDEFVFDPLNENAMPGSVSSVPFSIDGALANEVRVEYFNAYNDGTFVRQ